MSRTVELPDDVYQRLEEEASAAGATPAEWIAARLPVPCVHTNDAGSVAVETEGIPAVNGDAATSQKTLADRMKGKIGRISSGRTDLSERVSELFAEGLMEKRRTGHL
jgi:hypothetical protein